MITHTQSKISQQHPCFSKEAHNKFGRLHLPISPSCNIQCRFCTRSINTTENRPGVTATVLKPENAVETVQKALQFCPEITVVGIAGPGDTLATDDALQALRAVHEVFPNLIKCLSTNGLLLPDKIDEIKEAGIQSVTVTVNAVDPVIVSQIVSHIVWRGEILRGIAMGQILVARQMEGIRKLTNQGITVKVNTVLIPEINEDHIADIAFSVREAGAVIYNIIPLIPQGEFIKLTPPNCEILRKAKSTATQYIEVFDHCRHCRADACGIPGVNDFARQLYGNRMETFSHG
ncbi:MAG: radical SAM protein [Planctomycetaceae bacterium]|jgi:nitrogen fixation protein NifB|nr:radical SAM protein [Planctomycetaceae bacterium]